MPSLIDLIKQERAAPTEFIAPVPAAERVTVWTMQGGLPYHYTLRNPDPGWWNIQPASKRKATIGKPASPWQVISYLSALPRFYAIACFAQDGSTWVVLPYNAGDAAQRGWARGEPKLAHLISHQLHAYDVITVRNLAGTFLYDCLDMRLPHDIEGIPNRASVWSLIEQHLDEQTQLEAIQKAQLTDQERIKFQLGFMGASVMEVLETKQQLHPYTVRWEYNNKSYTMLVRRDMHIASAGICLSGDDNLQNLSSIVTVMEEARRLGRLDYEDDDD